MDTKEIENLPDRLPAGILLALFQDALDQFRKEEIEREVFLIILGQLTDRQVMTYELVRSDIRNDIDRTLSGLWNTESRSGNLL
jgi:hypothetical protein